MILIYCILWILIAVRNNCSISSDYHCIYFEIKLFIQINKKKKKYKTKQCKQKLVYPRYSVIND